MPFVRLCAKIGHHRLYNSAPRGALMRIHCLPVNVQRNPAVGATTSGIPISEVRKPIAGAVDEIDYEKLTVAEIRTQWTEARAQAGAKYIAAPGCSVPNCSTPEELARFPRALGV